MHGETQDGTKGGLPKKHKPRTVTGSVTVGASAQRISALSVLFRRFGAHRHQNLLGQSGVTFASQQR